MCCVHCSRYRELNIEYHAKIWHTNWLTAFPNPNLSLISLLTIPIHFLTFSEQVKKSASTARAGVSQSGSTKARSLPHLERMRQRKREDLRQSRRLSSNATLPSKQKKVHISISVFQFLDTLLHTSCYRSRLPLKHWFLSVGGCLWGYPFSCTPGHSQCCGKDTGTATRQDESQWTQTGWERRGEKEVGKRKINTIVFWYVCLSACA